MVMHEPLTVQGAVTLICAMAVLISVFRGAR